MANIIGDTVVRILVDANEFAKGIDDAEKKYASLGKAFDKTGKALTVGLTAPLVAAGVGLVKLAGNAAETADRLLDLEQITGLSTNTLQEFKNVAAVAGVDFESLVGSLTKFSARLDEIESGGGPAAEAVRKLGVNIRDVNGNVRSADELFPEFLGALSQVENVTERNAIAQNVFGRSLESLAPVLSLTKEELKAAREEAYELGVVQSKDALNAADTYRKALEQLKLSIQGQAQAIGSELAPLLTSLVPVVGDVARSVLNLVRGFTELPQETQKVILVAAGLAASIGPLFLGLSKVVSILPLLKAGIVGLVSPFGLASAGILAVVAALAFAIKGIIETRKEAQLLKKVQEDLANASEQELAKSLELLKKKIADLTAEYDKAQKQAEQYGQANNKVFKDRQALAQKTIDDLLAQQALIEKQIKDNQAAAEAAAKKAEAEAKARAEAELAAEEARRIAAENERIEAEKKKAAEEFLATLQRIDALQKAGALTEQQALEEKIKLREDEIERIKAAALAGEVGATAAVKLIKIQKDNLEVYYKRLKELTKEDAKDIEDKYGRQIELEKRVEDTKQQFFENDKKRRQDELKNIETSIRATTSVLNSSADDFAENLLGSIAQVATQFGQVEIAAIALIAQAGIELGKAIKNIFEEDEQLEANRVAVAQSAAKQILDNEKALLAEREKASKDYFDAELKRIDELEQAELKSLGIQDKTKLEQLESDIANAERRGEFGKKKKLEEELAKTQIEDKYEKQRQAIRDKQAKAEEAFQKESRRIARERAIIDKEIAIAQIKLQAKKAQSELPWYATQGDRFKLAVEYDNLIRAAQSIPIPALANGGIVMPKPGGTIARVAEAGVPEIVGPLDKVANMVDAMRASMGDEGMMRLVVNLDSKPFLDKIFPATKNKTVLISAASVV